MLLYSTTLGGCSLVLPLRELFYGLSPATMSRKGDKVKKFLLILAVAAMAAPAALAAQPPVPYDTGDKSNGTEPAERPLPNHGLVLSIKLNDKVSDGKDAQFTTTIQKLGTKSVRFASVSVVWFLDTAKRHWYAPMSSLEWTPTSEVDFVDLNRLWVRAGTLLPKTAYHLNGKVEVADRSKLTISGAKSATFYCVQLVVRASYPDKPNAGWREESRPDCRQYSVK